MSALPDDRPTVDDVALVEGWAAEVDQPSNAAAVEASGWRVTDEASADWAIRRVRAIRAQARARTAPARRVIAALEDRLAQIREQVAGIEKQAKAAEEGLKALLIAWHREVLASDPRAKSIVLPSGALRSRAGQPKVHVLDEWAAHGDDADGEFSRLEVKVDKRKVLAYVKGHGGLVPAGVEIDQPSDDDRRFEVEL